MTDSGCWEWQAATNGVGYGVIGIPKTRRTALAHRLAYEHWHGPIEPGHVVMHLCSNRGCVNPDHLRAGTHGDNHRYAYQVEGRQPSNLRLTDEQVAAIRADTRTQQQIAATYGCSQAHVSRLKAGLQRAYTRPLQRQ